MIYLDTCLVIYLVEDAERGPHVRELLARHGHEEFAISPLVRLECLVGPLRSGDPELEDRYRGALDLFVELSLDTAAFERAARLRASSSLRTPDALHLAAAQVHGCSALWTNDSRLAVAGRGLAVDVLHGS
ncbi:PIN domain-containing protein [Cellulosimicrobium funkei]|uniref:type II toxin-antitoxin system VapC family toxin n=1 Tax=Cellulosimicrobium TaxID=157920 RepID=UPI001302110B|nr:MULTISPECIES: PIN domain-containing protein [Cellulosimicrobium]MCM3533692.1 PIN domain-containing protein [Cellulosimicrobium funkei]